MKKSYIRFLGILLIVLVAGLIFTSLQSHSKYEFDKSAEDLHWELLKSKHFLDPNRALEIVDKSSDSHVFIDIRNPREFDNFHIEGAVNVPMKRVLDDEFMSEFKSNKIKILYSNESIRAEQIWLLLTQYGYENLLVLQGGANYWKENMMTKNVFKSKGMYEDEQLKFDLNKVKSSN